MAIYCASGRSSLRAATPIRGNEDWRTAAALAREALARAATATASPDDPPEFGPWLAALCSGQLTPDERDRIMDEIYALFDPAEDTADAPPNSD
jgi:hypothetical protein